MAKGILKKKKQAEEFGSASEPMTAEQVFDSGVEKESAKKAGDTFRVKATRLGYYGHKRRRPGDVFLLKAFDRVIKVFNNDTKKVDETLVHITAKEQFSQDWMEAVDSDQKLFSQKPQKSFGKHSMPEHEVGMARDVNEIIEESTGNLDVL